MTPTEIQIIHDYILEHQLLSVVESNTKANWRGAGSRATYYNAIKKGSDGRPLTLVEGLMMLEAQQAMRLHNAKRLEAAA